MTSSFRIFAMLLMSAAVIGLSGGLAAATESANQPESATAADAPPMALDSDIEASEDNMGEENFVSEDEMSEENMAPADELGDSDAAPAPEKKDEAAESEAPATAESPTEEKQPEKPAEESESPPTEKTDAGTETAPDNAEQEDHLPVTPGIEESTKAGTPLERSKNKRWWGRPY